MYGIVPLVLHGRSVGPTDRARARTCTRMTTELVRAVRTDLVLVGLTLYALIGWFPNRTLVSYNLHQDRRSSRCLGISSRRATPSDVMLRVRELLPSVWESKLSESAAPDLDAKGFRLALEALGRPRSCNRTFLPGPLREKSFGIMVHSLVNVLFHALQDTRLSVLSPELRVFSKGCRERDWWNNSRARNATLACFVLPLSHCSKHFGTNTSDVGLQLSTMDLRDRLAPIQRQHEYALVGERALPGRWSHRGLFWAVSQALAHLLRPAPRVQQQLKEARHRLGLATVPYPILAVHVRHGGGACKARMTWGRRRSCDSLSKYLPSVRRLVGKYGYRSILLLADDNAVLDDAAANLSGEAAVDGRPLHVMRRLERHRPAMGTLGAEYASASRRMTGRELGTRFIVDSLLIAECQGFIGKFSNHLARTAYALMAARHPTGDCLQPFISLDAPWCFGLNCDLTSWLPPEGTVAPFRGVPERLSISGNMLRLRPSRGGSRAERRPSAAAAGAEATTVNMAARAEWAASRRTALAVAEFAAGASADRHAYDLTIFSSSA